MTSKLSIIYHYFKAKLAQKRSCREALVKWQEQKIRRFIKQTIKKSPFYHNLYKGYDIKQWHRLPVIDKNIMMSSFSDLNTVKINKQDALEVALKAENSRDFKPTIGGITVGLSSGTSGNRGIFLVSPKEQSKWAGIMLSRILPYSIFKKHKIAFFLRSNSNLYTSVRGGKIEFDFFDMLTPLKENVEKLNYFNPTILIAPPSVLRTLAKELELGKLNINVKKIISVGEVLESIDKNYIFKHFKLIVHQVYQATEGFIAYTCKFGHLHLNEDIIAIEKEYIDKESGRFIPIITDFSRITQPIIRYRLNDILTESNQKCPCGCVFTIIDKIEGRCDDIFYLPSTINGELKEIYPDFISRVIIKSTDSITEYRVIQKGISEISVELKYCNDADINHTKNTIIKAYNDFFTTIKVEAPSINFIDYKTTNVARKNKRIICEL